MNNYLSQRLDGRIALVTGASRGIGEAIATALADRGAHVVVSSRKAGVCKEVVDKIRGAGGSAEAVACHIGDLEQIEAALRRIEEAHGRLDILVNNAAANPYFGHVIDTDLAAFQKTVDVNIRGYFFTTSNAARLMMKQKRGAVVNVASISGVVPGPNQGIYSITKAAVISMTKVFAAECAEFGIRVNAVLPGITDTKFAAALVQDEAMLGQYLPRVPLQRVARPEEMAGAVAFLASDASSYTTGACLNVDGGYLVS
ncbi:SDR family oxidoreductase [Noviherbaspirillum saxi]|uniref:SDR family oxidoreductase n=1 Tax=Noviherbaspirillum saxi TaxID=2320863 RepID=A0A3A3FL28_9BURK|nr:SDR family oxidoreductase [Noviherbaspirillum saxi]RJF95431.1 SDR family oxidoreductase [Noviherbaspirillum saxi]